MSEEILKYIRDSRNRGHSDETIKKALAAAGHLEEQIVRYFGSLEKEVEQAVKKEWHEHPFIRIPGVILLFLGLLFLVLTIYSANTSDLVFYSCEDSSERISLDAFTFNQERSCIMITNMPESFSEVRLKVVALGPPVEAREGKVFRTFTVSNVSSLDDIESEQTYAVVSAYYHELTGENSSRIVSRNGLLIVDSLIALSSLKQGAVDPISPDLRFDSFEKGGNWYRATYTSRVGVPNLYLSLGEEGGLAKSYSGEVSGSEPIVLEVPGAQEDDVATLRARMFGYEGELLLEKVQFID